MLSLPDAVAPLPASFASLFDARTGCRAQRLLIGAVLAPGPRTVCACLQVLGRQAEPRLRPLPPGAQTERAGPPWRPAQPAVAGTAAVPLGSDRLLDLRPRQDDRAVLGAVPRAKGVYRDAVRSLHSHFVKAMGLRRSA